MTPRWDPLSPALGGLLVVVQLSLAHAASGSSAWRVLCGAYTLGAVLSNMLFLLNHDSAHGLCAPTRRLNQLFSLWLNLPLVFPFVAAFRRYHMDHHAHLDDLEHDMDVPSDWEARTFCGRLGKFLWLNLQIVAYAVRPCLLKPLPLTSDVVENALVQAVFVWAWSRGHDGSSFAYLLLSMLFAGGFHPISAHFLSEHFDLDHVGDHTSSYYGVLNLLTFNVGYHAAHHDHPCVPWRFLPRVVQRDPRAYPVETGVAWIGLHTRFVLDDRVTLVGRRKRKRT